VALCFSAAIRSKMNEGFSPEVPKSVWGEPETTAKKKGQA